MQRFKEVVEQSFPGKPQLTQVVEQGGFYQYGQIAREIRGFPIEIQASFFGRCMEVVYQDTLQTWVDINEKIAHGKPSEVEAMRIVYRKIFTPDEVKRPNIEGLARLMAGINILPLKTGKLETADLQELATQSLIACNVPSISNLQIKIVDNQEVSECIDEIGSEESRKENHPMHIANEAMDETSRESGLNSFIHPFTDSSDTHFEYDVIEDTLVRSGVMAWQDGSRWAEFNVDIPEGRIDILNFIFYRLGYAQYWESLSHLLAEKGFSNGNPLKPYIAMMRPGLIPLGLKGDSFYLWKAVNPNL